MSSLAAMLHSYIAYQFLKVFLCYSRCVALSFHPLPQKWSPTHIFDLQNLASMMPQVIAKIQERSQSPKI